MLVYTCARGDGPAKTGFLLVNRKTDHKKVAIRLLSYMFGRK